MIQSAPNFPAHLRIDPDATIALAGELDLATVKIFDEVLDAVEFSSLRRLALDLERLSFIDLIGLRGVLRLHATCLTQSVALTIKRAERPRRRAPSASDWWTLVAASTAMGSSSAVVADGPFRAAAQACKRATYRQACSATADPHGGRVERERRGQGAERLSGDASAGS